MSILIERPIEVETDALPDDVERYDAAGALPDPRRMQLWLAAAAAALAIGGAVAEFAGVDDGGSFLEATQTQPAPVSIGPLDDEGPTVGLLTRATMITGGSMTASADDVTAPTATTSGEPSTMVSAPITTLAAATPTVSTTTEAVSVSTTTEAVSVSTTALSTTTQAGSGQSGQLVWEENFDSLDTQRWAVEHSTYGDGNNELQCYRPRNVSVVDGKLVLRAVTETYTCPNGSTRSVTSGMVRSRGVTFSPGHALEFSVKLTPANEADQSGLWPAVWSSGWAEGGWPRGGELDFLEVMTANDPTRSIFSLHYAEPDGSHGVTNRPVYGAANFSAAWHTIRFEYGLDGQLVWYLDGAEVMRVIAAETVQGYPAPFNLPIDELKINLALGGRPGPLSPQAIGSAGARFEMDFIRIYRL
ncbi:MAG: family 16 glycosylhydrolase [Actinomycetia bacterium]|nr:family 16 glycosylhydrolase [Actinomycetes bacterium]